MNSFYKHRHTIWQKVFFACVLVFILALSQKTYANTVAEEFIAPSSFTPGSVVSLNQNNPREVELTNLSNNDYMIGVVNQSVDNSVTYSKELSNVTVSLSGEVFVYVTDVGGEINKGDFVGASWIEGVAMKSGSRDVQRLLGVALEDVNFEPSDEYGNIETTEGVMDARLSTLKIRLFNKDSVVNRVDEESALSGFLGRLSGKDVSFARTVVVSVIFSGSLLIASFFVGSSIKGSFVSLGRNPRASTAIFHDLTHVTSVSLIVILMGTALSYVVLVL